VQTKKLKIGLFGMFGFENIGNDATLEAILLFLRHTRPNAELVCICIGPERVQADFGIAAINISWQRPNNFLFRSVNAVLLKIPGRIVDLFYTFKAAKQFDVMIIPGTGMLEGYGAKPWQMPSILFTWCLIARACGVKIGFVSVGAGPLVNPVNRWLMKSAARLASYRSYRDMASKEFMKSIGIDTRNDRVYPDIVFKLPTPSFIARPTHDAGSLTVGIGVMLYHGPRARNDAEGRQIYDTYLKKITRFVLWLLDYGHRVRLLVGDTSDQHAVDCILRAVTAARGNFPREKISAAPIETFDSLMREMADTDVVVASRFHNLICALKLNKPAISLGYRKPHDELMNDIGLGEFSQQLECLDVDRLIDQFKKLTSTRINYVETIAKANVTYKKLLAQQENVLAGTLLSSQ
jgi:polysaccharide pyruvyl transferase WcaK-like protein